MAIPLQRGTATSVGVVAASGALPKPTGVVQGDLLVVWAVSSPGSATPAGFTISGGAGWTPIGPGVGGGSTILGAAQAWWSIAGAAEPASYTVGTTGSDVNTVAVAFQTGTFDAVSPIAAFDYAQNTTVSTTHQIPSVTGVVDGVLLGCFGNLGSAVATPTYSGYTNGLVELADQNAGASGFSGAAVASVTLTAAGATAAATATTNNRRAVTAAIVVAPFTGPKNLTQSPADVVALVDGVTRAASLTRAGADVVPSADALTAGRGVAAGDSAGSGDAVTALAAQQRIISDTARVSDTVIRVFERSEIRNSQFVLDVEPYIPFGIGQTIAVEKFSTGAAEDRNQDIISSTASIRNFGTDLKTPPTWSWDMYTDVQTEAEALAWAEMLDGIWNDEAVQSTPNAVVRLRYRAADRLRCVFGRPGNFTFIPGDLLWSGKGLITADFRLSVNLYFEDTEDNSGVLRILPDSAGPGWRFPIKFPAKSAIPPAGAQSGVVNIGGKKSTPLSVDFHGPVVNPWVRIGDFQWGLRGSVASGQTITMSGLPWDMGVRRSDGAWLPGMLDPRARLSQLRLLPGLYPVRFGGFDPTGTSSALVRWRDAYGVM